MSNSDNQVILNEQPEGGGAWQERYSFKYSNFGSASFINKVRDFVTTHKQLLFVSIVCLLLFIGFIVDFSHGSRLRDLENGSREKSKDSWIDYDYSDDAPDLMVNMDVIGKYQRLCSAFYCPQSEYCYCLSKEAANFQAANRTCVQVLAGELAQFQDTDHEHEITYKLWRRSSLRKPVFWIGLTKTKDQKEPQWLNCTDCAKPSDLDSHEKKAVNVSHGDHSCLMISEGVLQKYPCISPRLRNHEKKYVMDESKSPYWFDEDVMGQVYGLNALCECNSRSAANRVPSKTSALTRGSSYYALSKYKFLDQQSAENNCTKISQSCYLVSFETRSEQKWLERQGFFNKYDGLMVWVGGKKMDKNDKYRWAKSDCNNQDLDFGTEMGEDTLCYALGTSVMSKHSWDDVIHGRDCQDFQAFACQVKTHSLKAAGAATDKQISLRLIQHLSSTCNVLDCITNSRCYCDLASRGSRNWKEAMIRCGLENMDMVIINDEEELKFLTTHDELGIRGYVAAHDFYNEKKLTWVNEKEGESGISNQATIEDSKLIKNWTATTGGCLYLKRSDPPFILQNCEIPGEALCEFDVKTFSDVWEQKQKDYEENEEKDD